MAAYAAIVSLMNTIHNLQNHPRLSSSLDKYQIESLGEKLDFLLDFVESFNSQIGPTGKAKVEVLGWQIASEAHVAEDVIESHMVDQILAGSTPKSRSFLPDLQKILEKMDSIKKRVMWVKDEGGFNDQLRKYSEPAASSRRHLTTRENNMVGFDDILSRLMEMLVAGQTSRQIIPIVGMGGIGKTILAKNVYANAVIKYHFDVCAWATISQEYSIRDILVTLLRCLGESTTEMVVQSEYELGEQLYSILHGKRYLIVLDDMWSIEVWEKMKRFLPDNLRRSRIIVTTRLSNLAYHFGSSAITIDLLDEHRSWKLFCEKAFGRAGCPPQLEEIGKRIVKKCEGLPLPIVVIGSLLGKSPTAQEYWENIEENFSSVLSEDEQYLNILYLSYSHLPAYLKPCFLYMGILPEDHEIRVSRLIKLWVAEGFLKPNLGHSLEEVAKGYIKDLIDRNLILVCSFGFKGKIKTCKIHNRLRDLCMWVADGEQFLGFRRVHGAPQDIHRQRPVIFKGSTAKKYYDPLVFHTLESPPLARSLICERPAVLSKSSRLLRVLMEVYSDSLDATFQQVNLRFLAYESIPAPIGWVRTYKLSSISLLWSVQTLIIDKIIDKVVAPSEIWEMPQLRHLKFHRICLPDPPPSEEKDCVVLENLQTIGTVLDFTCSEEVCKRMPNIRKLRIFYDDFSGEGETSSCYGIYNIGHFNRLESLCCCFNIVPNRDDLLQNLLFPHSLKKLTLQECELHWEDLTIIGSLPNLEVLKLKCQSVRGPKWNTAQGEFRSLRFLEIDSCYLICWNADSSCFPVLEKLVLCSLYRLKEIPSSVGEIATLQNIFVDECSVSAAISAIKILEEQESCGNENLHV